MSNFNTLSWLDYKTSINSKCLRTPGNMLPFGFFPLGTKFCLRQSSFLRLLGPPLECGWQFPESWSCPSCLPALHSAWSCPDGLWRCLLDLGRFHPTITASVIHISQLHSSQRLRNSVYFRRKSYHCQKKRKICMMWNGVGCTKLGLMLGKCELTHQKASQETWKPN